MGREHREEHREEHGERHRERCGAARFGHLRPGAVPPPPRPPPLAAAPACPVPWGITGISTPPPPPRGGDGEQPPIRSRSSPKPSGRCGRSPTRGRAAAPAGPAWVGHEWRVRVVQGKFTRVCTKRGRCGAVGEGLCLRGTLASSHGQPHNGQRGSPKLSGGEAWGKCWPVEEPQHRSRQPEGSQLSCPSMDATELPQPGHSPAGTPEPFWQ